MSQALLDGFTGGGVPTSTADDLIALLDEANVEKAVVLSLGYIDLPDESNMAPENDFTAAEVARYADRLIGFCGINPLYESALSEIDRCLDLPGMVGLKLHLTSVGLDWEDEAHVAAMSALFDKAQERDAPVVMHMSDSPLDEDSMDNLYLVIATHPELRLALAHCGGTVDWSIEMFLIPGRDLPPAIAPFTLENLYVDTSWCLEIYKDAPLSQRELMVWRLRKWGLDHVLFGSDYLAVAPVATPQEALETLNQYPFTQEEIDIILDNDASAWLFGP
jgi:predicted TIM-barrel fold metal-dependent hydrolase